MLYTTCNKTCIITIPYKHCITHTLFVGDFTPSSKPPKKKHYMNLQYKYIISTVWISLEFPLNERSFIIGPSLQCLGFQVITLWPWHCEKKIRLFLSNENWQIPGKLSSIKMLAIGVILSDIWLFTFNDNTLGQERRSKKSV